MTPRDPTRIPAIAWLQSARNAPAEHRRLAEARLAEDPLDAGERCVLQAVLALCALETLDGRQALVHAEAAVALDEPSLDRFTRADIYGLLAEANTLAGSLDAAHRALTAGEAAVGREAAGLLEIQRCHLHYRMGELDAALAAADRAVDSIPAERELDRARALNNRGVVRLYVGGARLGLADLERAELAFVAADRPISAAHAALNRGMMLARLGDLPAALATFDGAEQTLVDQDEPLDQHRVARAEVMVLAGLAADVAAMLPDSIGRLEASGMLADAAEARLYLAMAELRLGAPTAIGSAEASAAALRAAGRVGWAAVADDLVVQATVDLEGPAATDPESASQAARSLEDAGMRSFVAASWLRSAMIAEAHGRTEMAIAAYARLATQGQTLPDRVVACEALARRAALLGDVDAARRTAERGLRLIERNRGLFEATELRVQASGWGEGLAELLVDLAVGSGDGPALLLASERWRATALATRPPLPPPDDELAELLADYRAATAAVALVSADGLDATAQATKTRSAERAVTDALRRRSSTPAGDVRRNVAAEAVDALGDRCLIEFIDHRRELVAIVVTGGGTTRVPLGSSTDIDRFGRSLLRGLQQLAPVAEHRAGRMVERGVRDQLAKFVEMVIAPLSADVGDAPELLIVPTGGLQSVPWAMLWRRPTAVAPSVVAWHTAALDTAPATASDTHVAVLAGPGLPGAESEAMAVAALHRRPELFTGEAATVAELCRQAEGAALVHVACHAQFRSANPLFSHLLLADGPATGFDLERLQRAPQAMVLSACSTGQLGARSGGELLGLATVLLGVGTRSLVASLIPLPDGPAVPVLVELHRRLLAGQTVAAAVSELANSQPTDEPLGLVLASALACFGRGDWRLSAGA